MTKRFALVVVAVLSLSAAVPIAADAQMAGQTERIDASPKGTIGLGLAGANTGLIVASAVGLDQWWALTLFSVVGAAGGAVTGYFVIDDKDREKVAVGVLAGGIALTIPAVIMTVKAVRYDPDRDYKAPPARPELGELRRDRRQEALDYMRAGGGLIKRSASGVRVGVPAFEVQSPRIGTRRPSGAPEAGGRGVHVPIASGVF